MAQNGIYIGEAGELRVLSELLLKGFKPSKYIVDDGIDIVLDNKKTLQVKTCNSLNRNQNNTDYYMVGLTSAIYKRGYRKVYRQKMIADFLIIWIIPTNSFYVLPQIEVGNKVCIGISTSKKCKYEKFRERWELLN